MNQFTHLRLTLAATAVLFFASSLTSAQTEGIVHSFTGGTTDGADTFQALLADASGSLYGTTLYDGAHGHGVVFQLVPPATGGAWTENILYSFTGASDGSGPETNLVMDASGNLYGATGGGGALRCGTFFQLVPPTGEGAWTENTLYNFACANGGSASSPETIVRDSATGIIYGSVEYGSTYNGGWVYAMTPPVSGGSWTNTVLHSFNSNPSAPGYANGYAAWTLILAPNGGLFGTALFGGAGEGTVYRLTPPTVGGAPWNLAVLYQFGTDDESLNGANPIGLVFSSGVLYGTAASGGTAQKGIVYSLTPSGSGSPWTESILHNFTGAPDGSTPLSGVILGPSGVLYGTTAGGGLSDATCGSYPGCGTVFELTNSGGVWTETILHNFTSTGGDATNPNPGWLVEHGGVLYGTTYNGGAHGKSAVYAVHP